MLKVVHLIEGKIYLKEVYYNKILLAVNDPVDNDTINAVNAAQMTIGADIRIVRLNKPLLMNGYYDEAGKADGHVEGWNELCSQVEKYDFDALAIQSEIHVENNVKYRYFKHGGVNPWGGVEAIASKLISDKLRKPVAHSPYTDWMQDTDMRDYHEKVDPRLSAEMISMCYLHCIFKGLHKAPRLTLNLRNNISNEDVDFLITPVGCYGPPHKAAEAKGIPIIAVRENTNILNINTPSNWIYVNNYIEAAGLLMAYKSGINPNAACRTKNY